MANDNVVEFTDQNFEDEVLKSDKPVLVDFWAEWCPPCRALGPTIEKLASESQGRWVIGKLDTMKNPQSTARFHVSGIPVMHIFKRGQRVDELLGAQPKAAIEAKLKKHA